MCIYWSHRIIIFSITIYSIMISIISFNDSGSINS